MRKGAISRKTNETAIEVAVDLDGSGKADVSTGVGFFDHMLDQLARHSLIDIDYPRRGRSPRRRPPHRRGRRHRARPGAAQALGDKRGIARFADCLMPMDETLTRVALDVSGRPFLVFRVEFPTAEDRRLRRRAGARVLPGAQRPRRPDAAHRDALWGQQPPYRRILLQGRSARAWRRACNRSAAGRARSLDQGRAVSWHRSEEAVRDGRRHAHGDLCGALFGRRRRAGGGVGARASS